jgi:predicted Zn-dependent protease with MMP-like domain
MPDRLPPSLTEIEELAQRALGTIPRRLKRYLGPVVIQVEEFPDEETEAAVGLDSPFDILGLYRGYDLSLSPADPRLLVRERRRLGASGAPRADP